MGKIGYVNKWVSKSTRCDVYVVYTHKHWLLYLTFDVTVSHWWFHHVCAVWDLSTKENENKNPGNYKTAQQFNTLYCTSPALNAGRCPRCSEKNKNTEQRPLTIGAPGRWHCPPRLSLLLRPIGCKRYHSGRCPKRLPWPGHHWICSPTELCGDTTTPITTKGTGRKIAPLAGPRM